MFDVDKLFLMIPEFDYRKQIDRKALEAAVMENEGFRKWGRDNVRMTIDMIVNGTIEFEDGSPEEHIYNFYEDNKERFTKDVIRKVRYDDSKSPESNNRRQRNNMIIDIAFGILTHKDTAEKINNPGTFDKAKLAARIATITNDRDILGSYIEDNGLGDIDSVIKSLLNAGLKDLDRIIDKYKKERNPLSVDTFIYNHRQNMTGGALIGMYANNTTMQAKFQSTGLALKEENSFVINGRKIQSLHESYVRIGDVNERISKNCANFSAASVDNVKDPVLADLLQNTKTANIAGFMLRAGMSIQEIGLMFTQPIVRECIEKTGEVRDLTDFIKHYIGILKSMGGGVDLQDILAKDFTSEELLGNILMFGINLEGHDMRDTLASNIQSAVLFRHIAKMSKSMSELTQICRADSPNGAIARSIAKLKNQTHKVDSYIRKSRKDDFPFVGIEGIMRNNFINPDMPMDEMRSRLNDAKMPMLQAFYSLGIDFGQKLISRYFAQLNPYTNELVDELFRNSPTDSLDDSILEKFYSELVTFGLSRTSVFGNDGNNTFDQKRDYYLYDFPKDFMDIITDSANKDIANLSAFRKLRVKDGNIIMDRSGRLTPAMRETLMRDFDSLLYMNETARKLAVDLFMYSYYQDGFNFGPNSFGNFFSTNFITSFPEVVNSLRDMSFNISSESYWNRFLEQFYANHFNDGILPSFSSRDPFNAPAVTDRGQIIIERKRATNRNMLGNRVWKLVEYDGGLFQVDPDQIGEKSVVYNPVKTHSDPHGAKYNANMTAREMADIKVNEARVKAAKSVNTDSDTASVVDFSQDGFNGLDDMFADLESDSYSFEDGLASIEETPCNI